MAVTETSKTVVKHITTAPTITNETASTAPETNIYQKSSINNENPSGSTYIKASEGTAIITCPNDHELVWEKFLYNTPSLILSIFAIIIALKSFFYNKNKDRRSRKQSIHDDFWLRKIISPISIEPFLKFTTELRSSLPKDTDTAQDTQQFWTSQAKKINEFCLTFYILDIVDSKLASNVNEKLEKFEDCFSEYCGNLIKFLLNNSTIRPDRDECTHTLIQIVGDIIKLIQNHQDSVGNNEID